MGSNPLVSAREDDNIVTVEQPSHEVDFCDAPAFHRLATQQETFCMNLLEQFFGPNRLLGADEDEKKPVVQKSCARL